eukprot:c21358_g1_i2.p1 GENE.c21358_g1_i2~~c21358_g1_i2.p1  ORF type:complete len:681 (+),score=337.74 c21358_g1_i2:44-2086(+)
MSTQNTEKVKSLQDAIRKQADVVQKLKDQNATKEQLKQPVEALKKLKGELEQLVGTKTEEIVDRAALETLLKRRFFYTPSFGIYGGVKGLFDFGPPGCALKANFLQFWRQHFVLEENMLEVDCPCLTPKPVLQTSGHVEKFTDYMVTEYRTDGGAPEFFRADHLLEDKINELLKDPQLSPETVEEYKSIAARVDDFSASELGEQLRRFNVLSPNGFNISEPEPFNLMFPTTIGPTGLYPAYLRPETAQGIFVNFKKLLEYNGGKVPFAAAQIGQAFRNEISPRAGLLRVREFTLAEIEHFVNPDEKAHPKFDKVKNQKINLFPRERQLMVQGTISISIGDAVAQKMVDNETLGYFMVRTYLFLNACGIPDAHLRFRQHLMHEMAHYASDCWDAEIETSYGWVEVTGIADRACYDLTQHANATNTTMDARQEFDEPKVVSSHEFVPNRALLGKSFKQKHTEILDHLQSYTEKQRKEFKNEIESKNKITVKICTGESYTLTSEMISVQLQEKRVQSKSFVPSVIEPSFGVGRILYSILEHSYYVRPGDDEQRAVLKFTPHLAPVKCSVLPLMVKDELMNDTNRVVDLLTQCGVSVKLDTAGAPIGRKYARADEIGIPFGVTVDMQTIEKDNQLFGTVTLRERDSMEQVRVKIDEVGPIVAALCDRRSNWEEIRKQYPLFESK